MTVVDLKSALQNCEREPIHIPGSIQSHGILISLRYPDLTILQVSENVHEILNIHPQELLLQNLSVLMPIQPVERSARRIGEKSPRLLNPIPISIEARGKEKKFDGIIHRSGRNIVLELEPHIDDERGYGGFGGFNEAIREFMSRIMAVSSLQEVFDVTCEELRKLTGFSRVLVYKFDDEWNGTVIAESRDDNFDSLMKHRFPASDIPKQARELYTVNWLRLIPDVNYRPSPLTPLNNPLTDKPLDLTTSVLRSVSPVHVEYMKNLGQGASMSISLLKDKKLWGLISCHHRTPNFLKFENRVAAEFIGQAVSAQIVARDCEVTDNHAAQLKSLFDEIIRNGGTFESLIKAFNEDASHLLALAEAQGAALQIGEEVVRFGVAPSAANCRQIAAWFLLQETPSFYTEELGKHQPAFKNLVDSAAGLAAIRVDQLPNSALMWFRKQQSEPIMWGGDPTESKSMDYAGVLHPRKSFKTWVENVEGKSLRWHANEVEAIEELRKTIGALVQGGGFKKRQIQNFEKPIVEKSAPAEILREIAPESREVSGDELSLGILNDLAAFSISQKGEIQNCNWGASILTGFKREELLGRSIEMIFSDEDIKKEKLGKILDYVSNYRQWKEEFWLHKKDGGSFWGEMTVARRDNADGALDGYTFVARDISSQKLAEEEMISMRLAAESSNQAKNAFLANISHEIRTPLGVVLGFAELMTGEDDPKERAELFDRVKSNGQQLASLINDLLDISKAEAGKVVLEMLQVDLQMMLTDLKKSVEINADEKNIEITFSSEVGTPKFITTDPTRLRQILTNMLSNALKFTSAGGSVRVHVSMNCGNNNDLLCFSVTDTGRGMTEEEVHRLFKPFAQADATMTRKYGGTGLGLFISKRLARSMGGDLVVEKSEFGKGSTFLLTIDPGDIIGKPIFESSIETTVTGPDLQSLKGVRILVVDDSLDNRNLLGFILKRQEALCSFATNGEEGVEIALSQDFDIVLMDIQMPILDGHAAFRKLMAKGYTRPVLALTAHAMSEERDRTLALGFRDYITKPIDKSVLINSIRKNVDGGPASR